MDNRPIGVFDSGLGGLTAVKALRELMPNENIVYLGDTARLPYGEKKREELKKCVADDINFLKSQGVKLVLIACGTVSSNFDREELSKEFDIPIIEVLTPAAQKAAEVTHGKVGVIATTASIRAGAYKREILKRGQGIEVFDVACPKFVPLVENGALSYSQKEVKEATDEYILPLKKEGIDTLILGCTHYPLLKGAIKEVLDAEFIDVGAEAVKKVRDIIEKEHLMAEQKEGSCRFFVSSDAENFKKGAARFLKTEIDKVREVQWEEK